MEPTAAINSQAFLDRKSRSLILAVLIVFLGLFTVLSFVKPPWHDEIFSKYIYGEPIAKFYENLKMDSFPPLYYFLVNICGYLFDYEMWLIRLLSVFLVLGAGLIFCLLLVDLKIAVEPSIVLLIFLLHPHSFYYSVEARGYALFLFLIAVSLREILTRKNPYFLVVWFTLLL